MKVFIVEDEKIVALDIKNNLTYLGYKVVGIASSGEECLKKIKSVSPDLILMDIHLSGTMGGVETAEKISKMLQVPIVFLTAFSDDLTLKRVKNTSYYGYVSKPFKEIDLKTEIDFSMDRFRKFLKLKKDHESSQNSLLETEEFFKQVVNNVSDIIYRIDLKGYFTYLNPTAIKQTGYSAEKLMRMKYTSLIRSDYKQKAYQYFKDIYVNKKENNYFEFPLITSSGAEMWIGQKIHLLRSKTNVIGFQVIARDITHEKEFKEQLIIAKRNAENTAVMKSQFLANMSHELRTPLNGIVGIVNLLEKTNLSEKQKVYINAIHSSSNQLMGIINDILDLSKIEAGKVELEETEFDLYELIESVIAIFEMKTTEKKISISYAIEPNVPQFLLGDSVRLNQILYNLIGNAVKFTEKGGILLNIELIKENKNATEIKIVVADTGIGMEEGFEDKIFDAFTQAETSTTRKFGGTGLGLAIVKNLVELQGGAIEVNSKPKEGSTFTIHLPFKKIGTNREMTSEKPLESTYDFSGYSILLVEDNPINQLVTKDLLEDVCAEVKVAVNGQIALDMLADQRFDLVLMDMQMPVLDGYQTMKIIRNDLKDKQINELPIIALTANAVDTEIARCFSCGANEYLSKPFRPDNLYNKIKTLLNKKSMQMESDSNLTESPRIEVLEQFMNGKQELVKATLGELKRAFGNDLQDFQKAKNEGDYARLRSLAHRIKPNFLMVGMNQLGQFCKDVEHEQSPEVLSNGAEQIIRVIPRIIKELEQVNA